MQRSSPLLERGSRRALSALCPPRAAASAAAVEAGEPEELRQVSRDDRTAGLSIEALRRFGSRRWKVPGDEMILAPGQTEDPGW